MKKPEHKRVKKNAERGKETPDKDMVISVQGCCIVCGVDKKASFGKRTRVTFTSATVSIAVQF